MRSWKKMWKDELDALPPIGRQVLDAPSPAVCDEVTVNADGSLTRKKKILAFTLPPALVAVVLAVVLVCVFLLPVRDAVQRYAFMLEINPSVTVVTDADGTVTSVAATNADADIVLADGVAESMLGKPVGDALVIFADRAAMLGFIDTEGESAVRLTSCGDGGELLSDARETLETHFMEDGIYALVLSAERTVSDFAALCGAAASDTVSAVADFVENVSVFFRNRGVEDMTADELADAYENTVFDDAFVETAKDYLSDNLALIEKNAADVGNLYTLYFDILSHDDNPALVWKDYWSVKEVYGDELEGEFGALVAEMDEALARYEADYGVKIASERELLNAAADHISLTVEKLASVIATLSGEVLARNLDLINSLLSVAGLGDDLFAELMQLPKEASEYIAKAVEAASAEAAKLAEDFREIYNAARDALSREDYESWREGVLSSFQSEDELWESLSGESKETRFLF